MKTLEVAHGYSLTLIEARHFTEAEKERYSKWYWEHGLVGNGSHVNLETLTTNDEMVDAICQRGSIGAFIGCSNQAYEITDAEWDALVERDQAAEKAKRVSKLKFIISQCEETIAKCEGMEHLCTGAEAKAKAEHYNSIMNEGGEGYVPHYYTVDEYEAAKEWLGKTIAELARI